MTRPDNKIQPGFAATPIWNNGSAPIGPVGLLSNGGLPPYGSEYQDDMQGDMQDGGIPPQPVMPAEDAVDLQGADLEAFMAQLLLQFKRADDGTRPLKMEANRDEKSYNQEPYEASARPYLDALSVRIPAARSRVDKAASEIGSAFDRDGSPIYGATPLTPSMAEIAPHVEAFIHQNLQQTNAIQQYRIGIHRAFKVGTSFLVSEVVSRPVSGMNVGFEEQFMNPDDKYENTLVIRNVKMQDMYVLPVGLTDIKEAGFIGERFQMPRWKFNDMRADGFYLPVVMKDGSEQIISNGLHDDTHGNAEEYRRLHLVNQTTADTDPAGTVDLVRAWVRFQAPSEVAKGNRKSALYYVVFPTKNPTAILRLKKNPYSLLDQAPYVPMPAGMGDGTIWGESWMKTLRSLQLLLDTLHMLHIEAQKRAYSRFYLVKEGSGLADEMKARSTRAPKIEGVNAAQTLTRFAPDEWFETDDPQGDVKDFGFTNANPGFIYDEQKIINYMNAATIDDMPTAGAVRSAFEMRTAATQTAAKLKSLLKTISAQALKPHIEIVKAQLWEYGMAESAISEYVRFLEYGDKSVPITMTDYFSGVSLDPAGTTTSADETVAITTTASLIQEIIPMLMNIPGIVSDVPTAAREIIKARVSALGFQKWEQLFGLTPPTPEDIQKSMMYMSLVKQLQAQGQGGGGMTDPTSGQAMGGDGGAVMGAPGMNLPQTPGQTGDQQGGAQNGLAPAIAQQMGAPTGEHA